MKALMLAIAVCWALAIAGCDDDSTTEATGSAETTAEQADSGAANPKPAKAKPAEKTKPEVTVPKNVSPNNFAIREVEKGTGATAEDGDRVTVQYVGVGYRTGKEFDASWGGEPFSFQLGAGEVIPGWDQGVKGMKVGGRREMVIPPELAYGEAGSPPSIGPNETLVFVVDLLAIK